MAFLLHFISLLAQKQTATISGFVVDSTTQKPLLDANVRLMGTNYFFSTNEEGYFKSPPIPQRNYSVLVSHIGCGTKQQTIALKNDTTLHFRMPHSARLLGEITVVGKHSSRTIHSSETISVQKIADNANASLSQLLSGVVGVSKLSTGSGVAKPVVHGMYGNRLTILNQGVAQAGQQWGNDHSPEIDPMGENDIRVIKGGAAVAYQGSNLGNVVLVEAMPIPQTQHLKSALTYAFSSNGMGNTLNLTLERGSKRFSWRAVGTIKREGDKRTPHYFLTNTGLKEVNVALLLQKKIAAKWLSKLYLSTFNTEIGVLRGAHIGNISDLEAALSREVPFFTKDEISFEILAPNQSVHHHLVSLSLKYTHSRNRWMDILIASQINQREEYDVRRGGRSDIPALALTQLSQYLSISYHHQLTKKSKYQVGLQTKMIDNTNSPSTGILPLIPDYLSVKMGAFAILKSNYRRWKFEVGMRTDVMNRSVSKISQTLPRQILHYTTNTYDISADGGVHYLINDYFSINYNLGFSMRNPAVNELYSNGLHQGVSGIEEGNPNLNTEKSLKSIVEFTTRINDKFHLQLTPYHQYIQDYIYLQPSKEFRLTIRGAFPLFRYEQTNTTIYGVDAVVNWKIVEPFSIKGTYSFVRGTDQIAQIPLILLPSDNLTFEAKYKWSKVWNIDGLQIENSSWAITNNFVFKQSHLLISQDFTPPPKGYNLIGIVVGTTLEWHDLNLRILLKAENLLNTAYRDYMNRQRYFSDDLGRNIILNLRLSF